MKRMRTERERRGEKERIEPERVQQERRERLLRNTVMVLSILGGLMLAGMIRKYFGAHIPYIRSTSGKSGGWAGNRSYDPLILWGLIGGCGAGSALSRLIGIRRSRK